MSTPRNASVMSHLQIGLDGWDEIRAIPSYALRLQGEQLHCSAHRQNHERVFPIQPVQPIQPKVRIIIILLLFFFYK